MDGTADVGSSVSYARGDHVHPTDTSRFAAAGGVIGGSVTIGVSGTNNALTIIPGAAPANTVQFNVSGTGYCSFPSIGLIVAAGLGLNFGAGGANIRSGAGAATGTQPKGSIWMRNDGTVGATMYVSQGGGTWNAIAGV
jgi:hypothetical protein